MILAELWLLLPLEVATPTPPGAVYPGSSSGFAAYLVGGFFGLGVLILAMVLISLKPKRVDPDRPHRPGRD